MFLIRGALMALAVLVGTSFFAGSSLAQGMSIGAIFAQYPGGGPAMSAAIEAAVTQNPNLASEVVSRSRSGNDRQMAAAALGLARAANALQGSNPSAAAAIRQAADAGGVQFRSVFAAAAA